MKDKKQFILGTYGSISDGYMVVDDELYDAITGEKINENNDILVKSLVTDEHFDNYKNCGFDVMSTGIFAFDGKDYEHSTLKQTLDLASKKGLKVSVLDGRLEELCLSEDRLVGDGKRFQSTADVDGYIKSVVKDYCNHNALYALTLKDEPKSTLFPAIADVYKSLNRVCPNLKVWVNLLPLINLPSMVEKYDLDGNENDIVGAYINYLKSFTRYTGANYIMLDSYPFCETADGKKSRMNRHHLQCIVTVAEYCAKNNLEFYLIAQTFDMEAYDTKNEKFIKYYRKCNKNDMYWQTILALSAGVNFLQYFTYFPHRGNCTKSEMFGNEGCIVRRDGSLTELYYSIKELNGKLKKLAPAILAFDFKTCGIRIANTLKNDSSFDKEYLDRVSAYENKFEKISITAEEGVLFIAEKFDGKRFGYVIINMADPVRNLVANAKITSLSTGTIINENLERTSFMADCKTDLQLSAGMAVFIIID